MGRANFFGRALDAGSTQADLKGEFDLDLKSTDALCMRQHAGEAG